MVSGRADMQPLDVQNLRDHIEQRIINAILNGTFRSGERLVESAITEKLGVSRAPVREALSALEREGIVKHVHRRGYYVVDFTEKDLEEVYSLRLLLEIGALHRAIERVTEEDLSEMQRLVAELGKAAQDPSDSETIVALDLGFHRYLCNIADHSRLCSAWNNLSLQTQMLIGLTSRTHYREPEQPRVWHQRILDAIREKDLKRAEAILTDHVKDAQQRALAALQGLRMSEKQQYQGLAATIEHHEAEDTRGGYNRP